MNSAKFNPPADTGCVVRIASDGDEAQQLTLPGAEPAPPPEGMVTLAIRALPPGVFTYEALADWGYSQAQRADDLERQTRDLHSRVEEMEATLARRQQGDEGRAGR